jgi:hypothetical protein
MIASEDVSNWFTPAHFGDIEGQVKTRTKRKGVFHTRKLLG